MSYGLVICSACGREAHQGRNKREQLYWYHCDDKTPLAEKCKGEAIYPQSAEQIKGRPCGADDLDEVFVKRQRRGANQ